MTAKKHEWFRDIRTNILFMFLGNGSSKQTVRVYDQQSGTIREVSRIAWELDIETKQLIKARSPDASVSP